MTGMHASVVLAILGFAAFCVTWIVYGIVSPEPWDRAGVNGDKIFAEKQSKALKWIYGGLIAFSVLSGPCLLRLFTVATLD